MHPSRPAVLLIGGSDSSGGAGIGRDVHVCAEHFVDSAVAITAVTAQTDARVVAVHAIPAELVAAQIETALASRDIRAIKIGMLGCVEVVEAVAKSLAGAATLPVILDPVLVASSGGILLDAAGLLALRTYLLPRVCLITPNIPEAAALLDRAIAVDGEDAADQALALQRLGAANVLIKGGHASDMDATDILVTAAGQHRLTAPRIATTLRGTGCMLATAIAARMASGVGLLAACEAAKHYVFRQLAEQGTCESGHLT